MAGELITGDWELEYRGLLMGGNTAYGLKQIDGLLDLPDIVSSDQQKLNTHGTYAGGDYLAGRAVTLTMEVYGSTETEFATNIKNILTAFRPGDVELPLVFQIPTLASGQKIRVMARPRKRSWPITFEHYYLNPTIAVQFYCTDPRIYTNALNVVTTPLSATQGGLQFNAEANFSFGATATGGSLNILNDGTFKAPVVFRVDGPINKPRISHTALDKQIKLDLNVPTGSFCIIDTGNRTVLLDGTASRYSSLTRDSQWFDLEPGNNPILFRGATQTGGFLSTSWRSAWA